MVWLLEQKLTNSNAYDDTAGHQHLLILGCSHDYCPCHEHNGSYHDGDLRKSVITVVGLDYQKSQILS